MNFNELIYLICVNDDQSAFNQLYRTQAPKLCQFAYSYLGQTAVAEEMVNDVFVKIWLDRKSFGKIKNFQVYFYVCVKNNCLNYLRTLSVKQLPEIGVAKSYYFHLPADPSQLLISKELAKAILHAVNQLPPRCKLIFKMVKQDGLSCNEVAEILGISNKTVFAQLSIALQKLESLIK